MSFADQIAADTASILSVPGLGQTLTYRRIDTQAETSIQALLWEPSFPSDEFTVGIQTRNRMAKALIPFAQILTFLANRTIPEPLAGDVIVEADGKAWTVKFFKPDRSALSFDLDLHLSKVQTISGPGMRTQ